MHTVICTVNMKLLPLLATAASTVDVQPCRALTNSVHMTALLSRRRIKQMTLKTNTTCSNREQDESVWHVHTHTWLLTLGHTLSASSKGHVKCLSVAPPSSKANLEKTDANAAQNPAATAREKPNPLTISDSGACAVTKGGVSIIMERT